MQSYEEVPDGFGTEYFLGRFHDAAALCEERGVPLYCGEYGAISLADHASILRWYQDVHAAFEQCGIARAAWVCREMDFGIGDADQADIIDELIKNL